MRATLTRWIAALLCVALALPAQARTILFIGNSYTYGSHSAVKRYQPGWVTDLNGDGVGGVPAIFKSFAMQAGLDWRVSLETSGGKDLPWHLANKRAVIDRPWDVVILQGHSLLNPHLPGDGTTHLAAAKGLGSLFRARNPAVQTWLMSTWSRADQTYRGQGRWYGKPITAMADDLWAINLRGLADGSPLHGVLPVGLAWNRAMAEGVADPNPYDGIAYGKVSLWAWDHHHASAEGYYLEALIVFGMVTGVSPLTLGDKERAAEDLGIAPDVAKRLRAVAATEIAAQREGMGPS